MSNKNYKKHTTPSVSNVVVDENGNEYQSIRFLARTLGVPKSSIGDKLRKGEPFYYKGHKYELKDSSVKEEIDNTMSSDEFKEFYEWKRVKDIPFESYKLEASPRKAGYRYAVALFSDAHIEETVERASVLGLNEYNLEIAEYRIQRYFENLVRCLNEDKVNELVFASLGDTISGYIHEELSQCNGLSPLEATYKAQSLIYSGLEFICENAKTVKHITFIGIVGNHSRTTKKIQHANGFKMSYEWLMYQNIKDKCEASKLNIEFILPESELQLLEMPDGKRFIFAHGFQIKGGGNGTVCGIYPSLNRLSMKWNRVFNQDKIYIGHFHNCVSISNATVNGSIIGYNSFALTNGMPYEEPAQMYEVYDSEMGQLLTRKIYCN